MSESRVLLLNLPSPPGLDVDRDSAGGYGIARRVRRAKYGHSLEVLLPLFMLYLAAQIKKDGYPLKVLDAQAEGMNQTSVLEAVGAVRPQYLICMISLPSLYGDMFLLKAIKRNFNDVCVIVIGVVVRFLGREILASGGIDFLMDGEYPFYSRAIIQLIETLNTGAVDRLKQVPGLIYRAHRKESHSVHHNPYEPGSGGESLDALDPETYLMFPMEKYKLNFFGPNGTFAGCIPTVASIGCPFPCTYCPYPIGFGKKVRYKSPVKVVNEMEFLNRHFGLRAFILRDQISTVSERRIQRVCELIISRKLDIRLVFETRADLVSRDMIRNLKQAGCFRINFGVETGDQQLMHDVGKPGLDKEVVRAAFCIAAQEGIYRSAHVLLGLPGENWSTLMNTKDFLLELDPDGVNWNFALPYPGTRLYEIAKHRGWILTTDWGHYVTGRVVMRTEELSEEQLLKARREFSRAFRAHQVLRELRKGMSGFKLLARGAIREVSLRWVTRNT